MPSIQNRTIVALAVCFILIIGGLVTLTLDHHPEKLLKVSFPSNRKSIEYEPTNINIAYEYIFLENVFSTLVEIDQKGTILPGIAEKVFWQSDELHLQIRDDLKTQSGIPITISDVVFSLKRLLILSGNTHGNFKDLVCSGIDFKSLDQECPGIKTKGQTLILKSEKRKSFLLPMLAAIDFAIIPKTSANLKTLAIENYKETSGPYYVESDDGNGYIQLNINPHHYHYSDAVASTVQLVPITANSKIGSLEALLDGRVDLITTVDIAKADQQLEFLKVHPEFNNHLTQKIRSHLLVFTPKGEASFSKEERRYIGKKVRLAFGEIYGKSPGFEVRNEFFPSLSEGGLTEDQQKNIEKLNRENDLAPKRNLRLGLIRRGGIESWSIPINKYLPEAHCYFEDNLPDFKKYSNLEELPDAFIVSTDTGFMEDISLISYSLNAGFFGLSKSERNSWISDYMATEEKKDRLIKLKKLHYNALANP